MTVTLDQDFLSVKEYDLHSKVGNELLKGNLHTTQSKYRGQHDLL